MQSEHLGTLREDKRAGEQAEGKNLYPLPAAQRPTAPRFLRHTHRGYAVQLGQGPLPAHFALVHGAVFFLFFFAVGLMGVWAGICEQRDVKRMRNGELVLRSGELFILSRAPSTRYRHGYRFAIRNRQEKGAVEIYEMPEKLYQQFCARCCGGRYHARSLREESRLFYGMDPRVYQVDLVVLSPEKGPAFRLVELSDAMRRIAGGGLPANGGKYPVFTGTVADILYGEGRFDTFYVKDDVLFER